MRVLIVEAVVRRRRPGCLGSLGRIAVVLFVIGVAISLAGHG